MIKLEGNNIFFTSDSHFNQSRAFQLSRRPFDNIKHMNQTMVWNWNKSVSQSDIVIHLGDFGDLSFIDKLNGNIIFLQGNYQRSNNQFNEITKKYIQSGKMIVKYYPFKLNINDEIFQLTHQPSLDVESRVNFQLFGHVHKIFCKRNALNVGVQCHNYKPISLQQIMFWKNVILNHYDQYVFCE